LFALTKLASADVRSDPDEITFYAAAFIIWLLLVLIAFEYLGVSVRDDVVERRNSAATATICGLMVGETFCLVGSNSGNGPGPEVVLVCAALTTATLFLVWILLNVFSGIVDEITIDRNLASGIRAAGLLSGGGAILGASIAGDWASLKATLWDYAHYSWPILALLAIGILFERFLSRHSLRRRTETLVSTLFSVLIFSSNAVYALRVWNR
jgi:uncharacterized membrane protein YjfL (UPF0719 family)